MNCMRKLFQTAFYVSAAVVGQNEIHVQITFLEEICHKKRKKYWNIFADKVYLQDACKRL